MKTASNIFSLISCITNFIICLYYTPLIGNYSIYAWLLLIVCLIVSIAMMVCKEKHVALGILAIFFVNIFSGIFYLSWNEQ